MMKFIRSLLWFLLLLGYGVVIIGLLLTGNIDNFLHPRMIPVLITGAVILIGLTIVQLPGMKKGTSPRPSWEALLFLLPLLLLPSAMHPEAARGLSESRPLMGIDDYREISPLVEEGPNLQNPFFSPPKIVEEEHSSLDFKDEYFYTLLMDVYNTPDTYLDKEVKISGVIQQREEWPENLYIVSRMAISCCAADATTVGLLFDGKDFTLQEGEWFEVSGSLTLIDYKMPDTGEIRSVPAISVLSVEPVAPGNIYVF